MTSQFVLDENIQPSRMELKNKKFIPLRRIARHGTPDWLLLEILKEKNLTTILWIIISHAYCCLKVG